MASGKGVLILATVWLFRPRIIISQTSLPWYSYQFESGIDNREELVIKEVISGEAFAIGTNISEWKCVNRGKESLCVGITDKQMIYAKAKLTNKDSGLAFDSACSTTDLGSSISALTMFDDTAVVATFGNKSELQWFRMGDKTLKKIWAWDTPQKVNYLRTFKPKDNIWKLLALSEESSIDVYNFDLNAPFQFCSFQKLDLSQRASNVALNNYGSTYYLSVPQKSFVRVFRFEDRFENFTEIQIKDVQHVCDFEIGSKSYLAVAGKQSGIYCFDSNGLSKQSVDNDQVLEETDFWLPIKLGNYRQDVLVLAQRTLDHQTHRSWNVQLVRKKNDKFEQLEEIDCVHYGYTESGLDCLTDKERSEGIVGAEVIITDKAAAILVPKINHSTCYVFKTELVQRKSPIREQMMEMVKFRRDIEDTLKLQEAKMEETEKVLSKSLKSNKVNVITAPWRIKELSAPSVKAERLTWMVKTDGHEEDVKKMLKGTDEKLREIKKTVARNAESSKRTIKTLTIDDLIVEGTVKIEKGKVDKLNDESFQDVVNDCVRRSNVSQISGPKKFSKLKMRNFVFKSLKARDSRAAVFNNGEDIRLTKNAKFSKPVRVKNSIHLNDGVINNKILKDSVVQVNKSYKGHIGFEKLGVDSMQKTKSINGHGIEKFAEDIKLSTLNIFGNLTVQKINDKHFDELLDQICLKNIKCSAFGPVKIKEIHVPNSFTRSLNGLRFPEDYVFRNSFNFITVTGKKNFKNLARASEVIVSEAVDGTDPSTAITLSLNQTVHSKFLFKDLEVTESLNVEGEILGNTLSEFKPNKKLSQTNVIEADVVFKNLIIDGDVRIQGEWNGIDVIEKLEDVVYKEDLHARVSSKKTFSRGLFTANIDVTSENVNAVPLKAMLTKDTAQTLNLSAIDSFVTVDRLTVSEKIDGLNMNDLVDAALKLSANLSLTSVEFESIIADKMVVKSSLNGVPVSDLTAAESLEINSFLIHGNLNGNIRGLDLKNFDERRLSMRKEQTISASYEVENLSIDDAEIEEINDKNTEGARHRNTKEMVDSFIEGKTKLKELRINGSLRADQINGHSFDNIQNIMRKNKGNEIKTLHVRNAVITGKLRTDSINGIPFSDFTSDIILKNETRVEVSGTKIFSNGFKAGNIDAGSVNDFSFDNLLLKSKDQQIFGSLTVEGDVLIVSNLNGATIDDSNIEEITKLFEIGEDGSYIINGNVTFKEKSLFDNLSTAFVNGIDINGYFRELIWKNRNFQTDGNVDFRNKVLFKKNLGVKDTTNGVDLSAFKEQTVLTTVDANVTSPIIFADVVRAKQLRVADINTKLLNQQETNNLNEAAVLSDHGIPRNLFLDDVVFLKNLNVTNINDIEVDSLITLNTDQAIDADVQFGAATVFGDVPVGDLVNHKNFVQEYENTFLFEYNQSVESPVVFTGYVYVTDNLETLAPTNNRKNLQRLVTLDTDQILTSSYSFDNIEIKGDVEVNGLIDGINMDRWMSKAIFRDDRRIVNDIWNVKNVRFVGNVTGSEYLGGLNVKNIYEKYTAKRNEKDHVQNLWKDEYLKTCRDVKNRMEWATKQPYRYKYIDLYQTIDMYESIENVHFFAAYGRHFLMTSFAKNPYSYLFEWINLEFEDIATPKTGPVLQFVNVYVEESLYLVGRDFNGTGQIWKFQGHTLKHLKKRFESLLLQDSISDGIFYALTSDSIDEYKITDDDNIEIIRKWFFRGGNYSFVPPKTGLGTSLVNGTTRIHLYKTPINNIGPKILRVKTEAFDTLPKVINGNVLPIKVGPPRERRTLIAVAQHERTKVTGKLDTIKIYEDMVAGKVFHKIWTHRPTSLCRLEFEDSGETLLIFLENGEALQVYEYRGAEGFRHRSAVRMRASGMFHVRLPVDPDFVDRDYLVLTDGQLVKIVEVVMDGDVLKNQDLYC